MGQQNINEVWEKQESGSFWKPERENEEIQGEVIAIDDGEYGKNYSIKQDDGKVVLTGANKALLPRMLKVKIGDIVKIVYTGSEAPTVRGHKPTKLFDVFIKKA